MRPYLFIATITFLAACGDDSGSSPDARDSEPDARTNDALVPDAEVPDAEVPDAEDPDANPTPSDWIRWAREAADGSGLTLTIDDAIVTYLKPAIGNDPAGFTIQAQQAGPALFIAVDPATTTPVLAEGDIVDFTITTMATAGSLRQATAITGLSRSATGTDVTTLTKDVSAATDLVSALGDYESELVDVAGTVTGAFMFAGSQFLQATVETAGITASADLRIRVPGTMADEADFVPGCEFTLSDVPVGRFNAAVQLPAFSDADIDITGCPSPHLTEAVALSATTIQLTFDRRIDETTIVADGSQFTFDNGLTASNAALTAPRQITVTTSTQVTGTAYTVTVAPSLEDTMGEGIDPAFDQDTFDAFVTLAVVRINELNANIGTVADACDLIELRVVSAGTMAGFKLQERNTTAGLVTFPAGFVVDANDIIVVHIDADSAVCDPTNPTNETVNPNDQPQSAHAANYDTAFDFYSVDGGITNTDNVITLYNNVGGIVDAVFVTDDATGTAAADSEAQATIVADAGQWHNDDDTVPAGGYVDDVFNANAVLDLNGTGTTATGDTIQRLDNTDDNEKADWTSANAAHTWGLLNANQ